MELLNSPNKAALLIHDTRLTTNPVDWTVLSDILGTGLLGGPCIPGDFGKDFCWDLRNDFSVLFLFSLVAKVFRGILFFVLLLNLGSILVRSKRKIIRVMRMTMSTTITTITRMNIMASPQGVDVGSVLFHMSHDQNSIGVCHKPARRHKVREYPPESSKRCPEMVLGCELSLSIVYD